MSEALQTWAESDPIMSEVLKGVREAKRLRSENAPRPAPHIQIFEPGKIHTNQEYRAESPGDYFIHDSGRSPGQIRDFNPGLSGQLEG